jgi:hypothetical protein
MNKPILPPLPLRQQAPRIPSRGERQPRDVPKSTEKFSPKDYSGPGFFVKVATSVLSLAFLFSAIAVAAIAWDFMIGQF